MIGYRLKPHARTHFATSEFAVDIAVNGAGFRDDEESGPKAANERRILLLGDSLVLSVQVPFAADVRRAARASPEQPAVRVRYRVVNAGVQGYGPVEEQLFFRSIAAKFEPDLVVPVVFVGNDAEEAYSSQLKLDEHRARSRRGRRAIRSRRVCAGSCAAAWCSRSLRLRVLSATGRIAATLAPPEPPLQSYAATPAPRIAEGLDDRAPLHRGHRERGFVRWRRDGVALMPARFQVDEPDYVRLKMAVASAGGELLRDAATERFDRALAALPMPQHRSPARAGRAPRT